jgi:hypothetical protein
MMRFHRRRKLTPEETAANAARRADRAKRAMHCQICGRAILANTGLIAHHGYERPGQGWQTSSCFGARWRPYEVACDALPPAIEGVTGHIARVQKQLAGWRKNPPQGIEVHPDPYKYERGYARTVLRPAGFDRKAEPDGSYKMHGQDNYARLYKGKEQTMVRDLEISTATKKELEKRLAEWKPAT